MKKFAVLLLLFAFAIGGLVSAEVKEITIGGTIDLDLIWRNNYSDFDNDIKDQAAYAELEVNVPIVAKLTDNVSAEIELEESSDFSNGVGRANIGFDIDEAFITCKEFLWDKLTMKLGKQPISYDLRGKNGKKSLRRNQFWLIEDADPMGIFFKIEASENIDVDFFWLKWAENSKKGANPFNANSETGNSADADVYGAALTYNWNEVNMVRGVVLQFNDKATASSVKNSAGNKQSADREATILAIGTDLYFVEKKLELYGELGYQLGDYDDPAGIDMSAFGGYLGLEYTWAHDLKPYLGVEILYLEGDGDDDAQWFDFDSKYTTALIFEQYTSNNDSPNNRFESGGYLRASALGGMKKLPHNMRLDFVASWLQDTDDSADNAAGDNIGWEFDAIWGWNYTEDVKFELGFGWFFVDDDYAENGGSRGKNGYNANRDSDDAWLLMWNTTVKF